MDEQLTDTINALERTVSHIREADATVVDQQAISDLQSLDRRVAHEIDRIVATAKARAYSKDSRPRWAA
jgi:hypothetical protein